MEVGQFFHYLLHFSKCKEIFLNAKKLQTFSKLWVATYNKQRVGQHCTMPYKSSYNDNDNDNNNNHNNNNNKDNSNKLAIQ